jgi:hypothetical protein
MWSVLISELFCACADACSLLIINIWHVHHTGQRLTGWCWWSIDGLWDILFVHTFIELLPLWQFICWPPWWVLRHSSESCMFAQLSYLIWLPPSLVDVWLSTFARGDTLFPSMDWLSCHVSFGGVLLILDFFIGGSHISCDYIVDFHEIFTLVMERPRLYGHF